MMKAVIPALAAVLLAAIAWPMAVATESPLLEATEASNAPEGPAGAYYRWIDASGRIQYTDFEPIGVPSERIPLTPTADDDAPVLVSADGGRESDPFHDQDQQILPIEHIGPCAEARRRLSILHSSLPVYEDENGTYRTAWRGDSYRGPRDYLDAENRTGAIRAARNAVLEHCSDPEAFAREEKAFRDEVNRD